MKPMKSLLKVCLMISLGLPLTPALAQDRTQKIEKEKPAPYTGWLTPVLTFENLTAAALAKDDFEQRVVDCRADLAKVESEKGDKILWAQGGIIVGLVVGLLISSRGK